MICNALCLILESLRHRQQMEKNLERRAKEMGYKLVKVAEEPKITTE